MPLFLPRRGSSTDDATSGALAYTPAYPRRDTSLAVVSHDLRATHLIRRGRADLYGITQVSHLLSGLSPRHSVLNP
jgi:hypothetical protein